MKKVIVFLADGFEEIEAITQIDILRRAGIDVETVSIKNDKKVTGNFKVEVTADKMFEEVDFDSVDMLVITGAVSGVNNLNSCEKVKNILVKFSEENKWIASICASPKILGELGLLKNKNAVCYPGFEDTLVGAKLSKDKVVLDGKIITSKGPGTSFDFAYTLVEVLEGNELAEELKKKMMFY